MLTIFTVWSPPSLSRRVERRGHPQVVQRGPTEQGEGHVPRADEEIRRVVEERRRR